MTTVTQNKYQIPILEKGMQVIELIAQHQKGLTVQELVNSLEHSKTSIYRIVCSLEEMGYLRKSLESNSFVEISKFRQPRLLKKC